VFVCHGICLGINYEICPAIYPEICFVGIIFFLNHDILEFSSSPLDARGGGLEGAYPPLTSIGKPCQNGYRSFFFVLLL